MSSESESSPSVSYKTLTVSFKRLIEIIVPINASPISAPKVKIKG
jgi:hypothetical protein